MKVRILGPNQTELTYSDGTQVFFSYETPVAVFIPGYGYKQTATKWSRTTSRHVNKWLDGVKAPAVEQEMIDKHAEGVR